MESIKTIFLTTILFYCITICYAQKKEVFIVEEGKIAPVERKEMLPKKISALTKLESYIPGYISKKQADGFLSFSVDTIIENEKQFQIHIFKGQRYDTKTIVVGKKEQLLLQEAKLTSFIKEDNISIQQYPDLANKVVSYYENRGFPFSQVFLDSITIQNGQIEAKLKIERNQFILFDSIILKGNAKLSYSYLYPYLGLRKNKPYDEKVIRKIPQRMQELPFVTQALPAGIEFINDKAYLYVYLDKQRVNQFDGIIALVPVDEQSGKVALSGELNLGLKNVFTLGESISLEWRSPNRFSQYLNIKANFPYLFRTPFGVDGAFLLDKTDTSYLSINYPIGLQYSFNGNNYIKTYLDLSSSRILNKELLVITPDDITYADFNKQLYGIELMIRQLDYIYNPRKGFTLVINGAAGKIKIKQNHAVDPEVYDGVEMERTRYRLLGDVKGYIPLGKRFVLHVNAHFGTIVGENNLENELFKIGGFKTLRGFDEHSILASTYAVGLAEARYLFAKNSYIHLFYNMAGYEHSTTISYVKDYPIGFGAGVAFQTKAGLFNLIYALGRQFDNPISFKSGKIHFGIVLNF